MRQEIVSLNTIRELVVEAREQLELTSRFKRMREEGKILGGAELCAHNAASAYFYKAKEMVAEQNLIPPQNNRMDYLVAD